MNVQGSCPYGFTPKHGKQCFADRINYQLTHEAKVDKAFSELWATTVNAAKIRSPWKTKYNSVRYCPRNQGAIENAIVIR